MPRRRRTSPKRWGRPGSPRMATTSMRPGRSWVVQAGHRLLFFDDNGHCGHYAAHLVVNQNAHATPAPYGQRAAHTALPLGPRFAVLRREFAAAALGAWRPETDPPDPGHPGREDSRAHLERGGLRRPLPPLLGAALVGLAGSHHPRADLVAAAFRGPPAGLGGGGRARHGPPAGADPPRAERGGHDDLRAGGPGRARPAAGHCGQPAPERARDARAGGRALPRCGRGSRRRPSAPRCRPSGPTGMPSTPSPTRRPGGRARGPAGGPSMRGQARLAVRPSICSGPGGPTAGRSGARPTIRSRAPRPSTPAASPVQPPRVAAGATPSVRTSGCSGPLARALKRAPMWGRSASIGGARPTGRSRSRWPPSSGAGPGRGAHRRGLPPRRGAGPGRGGAGPHPRGQRSFPPILRQGGLRRAPAHPMEGVDAVGVLVAAGGLSGPGPRARAPLPPMHGVPAPSGDLRPRWGRAPW